MGRFGIEEEFILLDDTALVPLAMGELAREMIAHRSPLGTVTTEYLTSQLECVTGPASTRAEAEEQLRHLRGLVAGHAAGQRAIVGAIGAPFASTKRVTVWPSAHYNDVSAHLGHITRGHEVNGLHVHVEVADAEERVRALNRVRGWLPVLAALTGNSPFADGLRSGFESWRSVIIRRLPSSWSPPRFADFADYRAHVAQLIDIGTVSEAASLSWAARLSERYPTVEVRVFDSQLTTDDALFAAVLTRAIVLSEDLESRGEMDGIDASLWMAARSGMQARVIDPTTGDVAGAWTVAEHLLEAVHPALEHHDDLAFVTDRLERIRAAGTGAARQLRAYEQGGIDGLRRLYREGTVLAPS